MVNALLSTVVAPFLLSRGLTISNKASSWARYSGTGLTGMFLCKVSAGWSFRLWVCCQGSHIGPRVTQVLSFWSSLLHLFWNVGTKNLGFDKSNEEDPDHQSIS